MAIVPLSFLGLHASCDRNHIVKNRLRLMSGSCEMDAFFKLMHSKLIDVYIDSTRSKRFLSDLLIVNTKIPAFQLLCPKLAVNKLGQEIPLLSWMCNSEVHSVSRRIACLNVYIRERHNCASCPWMDVPHRASSAMFKEAVLISALVRRSRLGYPQESHIAMIAEYA